MWTEQEELWNNATLVQWRIVYFKNDYLSRSGDLGLAAYEITSNR